MLPLLVLLPVAMSAAPTARWVLEVGGVPVAAIEISVKGDRYVYATHHFLEEGQPQARVVLSLEALGAMPETLALSRMPEVGCRDVIEERTKAREALCVSIVDDGMVRGTLDEESFTAWYDGSGALETIEVGPARWTRAPTAEIGDNPFERGFAIPRGASRFTPTVEGARWLELAPLGIGEGKDLGRTRCLVLARKAQATHAGSRIAVGLVLEDTRAFPHAWLVHEGRDLDPSIEVGGSSAGRRYVEFPAKGSGRLYLQLFANTVRLTKP